MARKRYFITEEVLQELAMDSDSDLEPEDDDVLPDGDDFVTENSDEAVLDESVFICFYEKGLESVCLLNYPSFQHGHFFVFLLP